MSKINTALNEYRKYGLKYVVIHTYSLLHDAFVRHIGAILFGRIQLKDTVVIESHNDFDCNGGAFYQYMLDNGINKHWCIVWLITHKKPASLPENVKCFDYYKPSILKEYYCCTARVMLNDDKFIRKRRKEQICIYCMHGPVGMKNLHGLISVPDYVDYILSPSEWHDPDLCWNLSVPYPNDRMLHIGFPSDDNIINSSADECSRIRQTRYSKYVLWMPTLRSNSMSRNDSTDEMPFGIPLVKTREQLERIDSFCREHDCLLIIKIHPMQRKETYQGLTDMGHIAVLDGDKVKALGIDNYRLMKNCDAMMSDFSSSTFSFLMLNRPVAFDFSDLEYYKHAMPDEIINAYTPGMKVYSIDDFIAFLRSVCDGEDEYREERSEFVEKLYTYRDGNACRRLAEFVGMIPKE